LSNRKRNIQIKFEVTKEEKEIIDLKIEGSGLKKGAFYRKMIIDGIIVKQDIENIENLIKEVNRVGVNINQTVRYINQVGSISEQDYKLLKKKLEEIWKLLRLTLIDSIKN
jgi:hypothetical protein